MTELLDAVARRRITEDTAATLFVNAGAGSGKTSALVDRIATLVLRDGVPLNAIAAVTFTEKAGAELRDRLRATFEDARRTSAVLDLDKLDQRIGLVEPGTSVVLDLDKLDQRTRADEALDDLDAAAIGTLHAFAQRILMEHPIEAGLPPLLEVLDEVGSSVAFEDRWSELQTDLLEDDDIAETLLLGMACGVQTKHVRSLALLLGSDWDLIEDRVLIDDESPLTALDVSGLAEEAARIAAMASQCRDPEDRLAARLPELEEFGAFLRAARDDSERIAVLDSIKKFKVGRTGNSKNWPSVQAVRDACAELVEQASRLVAEVLDQCLRTLTRWTARKVLAGAEVRRAEGTLEFHDLLVLARNLLRKNADVRAALHDRYQRLLLDEFQDTDPIQIELAVRIAGGEAADAPDWRDVEVPPGRIFVVGDPKQSIYRFRRASIATYLDAEQYLGDTVSLTTNFRTGPDVLDWVNGVFGDLISFEEGGQPAYEPLAQHRPAAPTGPPVTVLGAKAHDDLPRAAASILREREAADVAAVIRRASAEQWQVHDERADGWRPVRHDDIAILVPARTSLPFLEDALDEAGVPYRAEASSLVYQSDEVRSLLACARAVADPSDALSLVTALRSPAFGCGDDDLWRWKHAGGSFSIYSRLEDESPAPPVLDLDKLDQRTSAVEGSPAVELVETPVASGPVGRALAYLRRLSFDARWMTPSEVLGAIIADRRMLEIAATGPRERDTWRRLRFVVDQARAWSEVSHGGLRAYLAWAAHQGQETTRVAEAVLPETDTDAVKVMTIHAAKGLEFPIVILSGMTSESRKPSGVQLLWPSEGGYAVKLTAEIQTGDFEAAYPVDEQMDGLEKRRLLYVAATRARDHLVVSLHRNGVTRKSTAAQLLTDAGAITPTVAQAPPIEEMPPVEPFETNGLGTIAPPPEWESWLAELTEVRDRSRLVSAISASGLEGTEPEIVLAAPDVLDLDKLDQRTPAVEPFDGAQEPPVETPDHPGRAKGPRDVELPPWSKGRYGSAIGRAVHGVLQVINLATANGLDDAVAAQSLAEGVTDQADLVRALVMSALDSDVVQRAATRDHWRETYVATVHDDGTILEGFVDLVYRDDDGSLVIVDYKTDAVPAGAIDSRVEYYRPQLRAYVDAHAAAQPDPVRAELLFLHPAGAVRAEVANSS